jgi:ribose 1,5-bisphosphokinase
MSGLLVLVVGPSGSGKDTLLLGAAKALVDDARFRFVRRVVTRPAAAEDHEVADAKAFAARRDAGGFALHWEAHGLHYGIPADTLADVERGRVVVANVSRGVVAEAAERFPAMVIEITVSEWVRAIRLRKRGREAPDDMTARLARDVPLPEGLPIFTIVNDGTVNQGVEDFMDFLLSVTVEDHED